MPPLKKIETIFNTLNSTDISYCHWKSNDKLDKMLSGYDDLDLLVAESDRKRFEDFIFSIGFKQTREPWHNHTPHVFHYFALDEISGEHVHLHVYYRLITGGSIKKNLYLPFEQMFFESVKLNGIVKIPAPETELIFLVCRKMIEHLSVIELRLLNADYKSILGELKWLIEQTDRNKVAELLSVWIKDLAPDLFFECFDSLVEKKSLSTRLSLAIKMNKIFKKWRIQNTLLVEINRFIIYAYLVIKVRVSSTDRKERWLKSGGKIIAFIGPEASGKSTLSKDISKWLGERFDTVNVHCGKPPAAVLTFIPKNAIKIYVKLKTFFRKKHSNDSQSKKLQDREALNVPRPIVCLIDAYERYKLTCKMKKYADKGTTIVTDRYPSTDYDAIDGPKIEGSGGLRLLMAKMEKWLYFHSPKPDLVIKVNVPLEVTLKRNSTRPNPEPESFLRMRYEKVKNVTFANIDLIEICNTGDYNESLNNVKKHVYDTL